MEAMLNNAGKMMNRMAAALAISTAIERQPFSNDKKSVDSLVPLHHLNPNIH
jgi:hypothetical protein